jgi:hypothetical protein
LLNDTKIEPLTEDAGRKIGRLLAKSKTSDVVDGHVALLLTDGGLCITSDPRDIKTLIKVREISAQILAI